LSSTQAQPGPVRFRAHGETRGRGGGGGCQWRDERENLRTRAGQPAHFALQKHSQGAGAGRREAALIWERERKKGWSHGNFCVL